MTEPQTTKTLEIEQDNGCGHVLIKIENVIGFRELAKPKTPLQRYEETRQRLIRVANMCPDTKVPASTICKHIREEWLGRYLADVLLITEELLGIKHWV